MLQRQRSVRQIDNRDLLNAKSRRDQAHAIAGLDPRPLGVKAPLRLFFIARGNLAIDDDDRVQADPLDSISGEVHPRAVLSLIGIAGRVDEKAGLRFVIPFRAAAGDALLIALIENHVAFGDDFVCRFVNRHFVGLQAVRADARVDIAFINFDNLTLRPTRSLFGGIDAQRVARLYRRRLRAGRAYRLILLQRIDVRRVGDRVGDFAFDRTGLLRRHWARPHESKDDGNPEKDWQERMVRLGSDAQNRVIISAMNRRAHRQLNVQNGGDCFCETNAPMLTCAANERQGILLFCTKRS